MRRSAGEGAVYQRKTGAKKGLWVAEYDAGGKRKYLYGKNKKAVTEKLKARLSSGETDLVAEADTMLVGAYLDGGSRRSGVPSRSGPGRGLRWT